MIRLLVIGMILSGCGWNSTGGIRHFDITDNRRGGPTPVSKPNQEVEYLKSRIFSLEGTVAMITNFVAGDFTDCTTNLPPFETKLCQVAQTANAEQIIKIAGQLTDTTTTLQTSLYGAGCSSETDVGCPAPGSVLADLATLDPNDIIQLQADVTAIEGDINDLNTRFDDFDGSGQSIETVISNLDTRIDDIESLIGGGDYYTWIFLCDDISGLNKHEPLLMTGDRQIIRAYSGAGNNGMAQISVGDGSEYFQTSINPKCKIKVYDVTTELKVCWNNTNKDASEASIDTECDNGGASPTASCTCK